jgi:hypothetical protein
MSAGTATNVISTTTTRASLHQTTNATKVITEAVAPVRILTGMRQPAKIHPVHDQGPELPREEQLLPSTLLLPRASHLVDTAAGGAWEDR